jgi:biopolymer transport protein ExbD
MGRFSKDSANVRLPKINTASLPDIVSLLLIFFMVTTNIREVTYKVRIKLPHATELTKLEKKSLVSFIYIGEPLRQYQAKFGVAPRIQLDDQFANTNDLMEFITKEREVRNEADRPLMIVSIKCDETTKMGIVSDVKQELRKAAALHINYSSRRAGMIR